MAHFAIASLGHGGGGFLTQGPQNPTIPAGLNLDALSGRGAELFETSTKAKTILDNILSGIGLPQTSTQITTDTNLINLGLASVDISNALSEQVTIREQQRARDNEALQNTQLALGQINERLSRQVIELGDAFKNLGSGGLDPIKFFTDNPILGGIGIGGLLIGGVVLLLVLK